MNIDKMIQDCKLKIKEEYQKGSLALLNSPLSFETKEKYDACVSDGLEYEHIANALEELKRYKSLEKQGKLLEIPCKIGDKVYREWSCGKSGKSVAEFTVTDIDIKNYPDISFTMSTNSFPSFKRVFSSKDIGTTIFLNKSDAEGCVLLSKKMRKIHSMQEEIKSRLAPLYYDYDARYDAFNEICHNICKEFGADILSAEFVSEVNDYLETKIEDWKFLTLTADVQFESHVWEQMEAEKEEQEEMEEDKEM